MAASERTVERFSNPGGRCIELLHNTDDPTVWIVRESTKLLWFRLRPSTVWFFNKQQAVTFAHQRSIEISS